MYYIIWSFFFMFFFDNCYIIDLILEIRVKLDLLVIKFI